jgi:poly-gamma-glutamate synthesis protein (capsule biosynthesis protein)
VKYGIELIVVIVLCVAIFIPYRWDTYVEAPDNEPIAHVLFAGDMMFDRYIRTVMETTGGDYVFSCIDQLLLQKDLVVANLEGPITAEPSVSQGTVDGEAGHYTFTFPPETAPLLVRHNIKVVHLGNNHIMNFSRGGLLETKVNLDLAGVQYFGDPDVVEGERVLRTEVEGIPLSLVSWSDWTSDKTDHTVAQVRKEKEQGRLPIVYAHWGDEYVPPPERVKILARQFVDAGAVLVTGSHSHVVSEHEWYKDVPIFYSLGNFVFDQYFSEAVRNAIVLEVDITKDGVKEVREVPIVLHTDGRTCLRDWN